MLQYVSFKLTETPFFLNGAISLHQHPHAISELVAFFSLAPSGGFFNYACGLFNRIPYHNLFIYKTMIRGAVRCGRPHEAIRMYRAMRDEGVLPNNFTFSFILGDCERLSAIKQGEEIHGMILRCGFRSVFPVMTTLLNMYSSCGEILNAIKVFNEMPQRDVVSWNSMIAGYLKHGDLVSAHSCFDRMDERSLVSWNPMIFGYANSGEIEKARQLFEGMPTRDVVSWNSMIGAYCRLGDVMDKLINTANHSNSRSSWEMVRDLMLDSDKREQLAESLFLCLKQRFPSLSQTTLDMCKIQCNTILIFSAT